MLGVLNMLFYIPYVKKSLVTCITNAIMVYEINSLNRTWEREIPIFLFAQSLMRICWKRRLLDKGTYLVHICFSCI
jgi:hypothetical protein